MEIGTVLLIEQEKEQEKFVGMLLEFGAYYNFYSSYDYEENNILYLIDQYNPEVLILDLNENEQKVINIIQILNQKEYFYCRNKLCIIVLGNDDKNKTNEEKFLKMGVNDFISDPYKFYIIKLKIDVQLKILSYIKEIERLSLTDKLTNLPNRRSFDMYSDMIINSSKRNKESLTLIICDIDKFKTFNDTYGHQIGDMVLIETAKVIQNTLRRDSDFVSRWGGEEFVILLNNLDMQQSYRIAEKIRKAVENNIINILPNCNRKALALHISISLGVCFDIPLDGLIDNFVKNADEALYAAKEAGRNKTVFYNIV